MEKNKQIEQDPLLTKHSLQEKQKMSIQQYSEQQNDFLKHTDLTTHEESPLTKQLKMQEKIKNFEIFGYKVNLKIIILFYTIMLLIGWCGQTVTLPMALSTFGNTAGAYVVLFISSTSFCLLFGGMMAYKHFKGKISPETYSFLRKSSNFKYLIFVGVTNGMNGFLIVFSASPLRVPPVLQPILLQSQTIFTLLFSIPILKKTYNRYQYLSCFLVAVGILISFIPLFIEMAQNQSIEFQNGAWWALIMIIGTTPAVLQTIIQEKVFDIQRKLDEVVFLFWNSIFQLLFVIAFFWLDIIPSFGTSDSYNIWGTQTTNGIQCYFGVSFPGSKCQFTAIFMIAFAVAYVMSYQFQAYLTKYSSANYAALVMSAATPISTVFWIAFPAINTWVGGSSYKTIDIIFYLLCCVFILPGSFFFRKFEMRSKMKRLQKFGNDVVPIALVIQEN